MNMHTAIDFKPDVRYAYATGRIRVLETKLLSASRVEKMIESPTIKDAMIYLEDTAYDDTIGEISDPEHYEELVTVEKRAAFALMERLVLDEAMRSLFHMPYDFHNVKLLVKLRLSKSEVPFVLSEFGTIAAEEMRTAFETEHFSSLPLFMRETIGQALAHHYLKKDIKSTEFVIDNLEYRTLLATAIASGIPLLSTYMVAKVDLTNIATFIRIKYFETEDNLSEALIQGGSLDPLFFMQHTGESLETLPALLRNTPYRNVVEVGIRHILEAGSFSSLDRETENYLMSLVKLTRYITFGAEPLFAYFAAREQDLNIIKMLLVGKINELSKEEIRERIPITYN